MARRTSQTETEGEKEPKQINFAEKLFLMLQKKRCAGKNEIWQEKRRRF